MIRETDYEEICKVIAPYALNRQVCKEIGINILVDPGAVFYIQRDKTGMVGFIGMVKSEIKYAYIIPKFRGKGVFTKMLTVIKKEYDSIRVTCTNDSLGAYLKNGFQKHKQLTNYHILTYSK